MAARFLRAASYTELSVPVHLEFVLACEKDPTNRELLAFRLPPHACVHADVLAYSAAAAALFDGASAAVEYEAV
eukprot:10166799-Alexandrium_andersonii.AAC.1